MIKRLIRLTLLALTIILLRASMVLGETPHGNYIAGLCSTCHAVHEAPSPGFQRTSRTIEIDGDSYDVKKTMLLRDADEKAVCYTCHNGTASAFNVAEDFGETTESIESTGTTASMHPVPDGTVLCSDCHSAHVAAAPLEGDLETYDKPYEAVRLLRSLYEAFMGFVVHAANSWLDSDQPADLESGLPQLRKLGEPYEHCGACHGAGSTLPGGDVLEHYSQEGLEGTKHDSTMSVAADSEAQIACASCHRWHSSTLEALLAPTIAGTGITANDNQVCYSCHLQSWIPNYLKIAFFDDPVTGDVHGAADSSKTAGSPGLLDPYDYGMEQIECKACHDPHGSGNVYWIRTRVNDTEAITLEGTEAADRADWEGFCGACHTYTHDSTETYDLCVTCHFHGAGADETETTIF
jgi:predicted CXXCH cytochrome family protein